jgi:hypothetical protein
VEGERGGGRSGDFSHGLICLHDKILGAMRVLLLNLTTGVRIIHTEDKISEGFNVNFKRKFCFRMKDILVSIATILDITYL